MSKSSCQCALHLLSYTRDILPLHSVWLGSIVLGPIKSLSNSRDSISWRESGSKMSSSLVTISDIKQTNGVGAGTHKFVIHKVQQLTSYRGEGSSSHRSSFNTPSTIVAHKSREQSGKRLERGCCSNPAAFMGHDARFFGIIWVRISFSKKTALKSYCMLNANSGKDK